MTLEPIGDIADVTLTEQLSGTLTWGTEADWDNGVDEAGVVHKQFGDYPAGDVVQLGYPDFDRGGSSLWAAYPLYEDSGSTANDVSGNGRDGTYSGVTLGQTGLHNTTYPDFDGTDDVVDVTHPAEGKSAFTLSVWVNGETFSADRVVCGDWGHSDSVFLFFWDYDGTGWRALFGGGPGSDATGGGTPNTNEWYHLAVTYKSDTSLRVYENGTEVASVPADGSVPTSSANFELAGDLGSHPEWDGRMGNFNWWSRELSATEVQALADTGTGGHIETATKSFSGAGAPDLQNLQYSLNGHSIDLDVIGSPGTADEEVITQTLDGASSYTLSWGSTHQDFRVRPNLSTTDVTVSPTVSQVELVV